MSTDSETPEPEGEGQDNSDELDQLQAEAEAEEGQTAEGEFIGAADEDAEGPDLDSKDVCRMLASATFEIIAARKGAHWALTKGEADQLGEAYGPLVDKYLPEGTAGPELTAVMITALVVMPRAQAERQGGEESAA